MSEIKCPQCATDNVQRIELAYMQGSGNIQARSNTVGTGIGRGGGRWGVGVGGARTSTTGNSQSYLAESLSPPSQISYSSVSWLVGIGGLVFLVGAGTNEALFLVPSLAFVAWGGYRFYRIGCYNERLHPKKMAEWRKNWICQRCGDVFVPAAS